MKNSYNSFAEIDQQLKIISLQKQIYKQYIKRDLKSVKGSFNAVNIKEELKSSLQEQLLRFILNNWIKKFR
ncbi:MULTISPECIES: DUF6327 family protein [unclassified Lacinutrix]